MLRIGGLASGMDTEQIVRDLMKVERMKVDRLFQKQQTLKWRQEAYWDINRRLANFVLDTRKDFGLNQISYTGAILPSSTDSFTWAKKATSSNESIVKVSALTSAMNGSHTIKVDQLAETARVTSTGNLQGDVLDANLQFTEAGSFELTTDKGSNVLIEVQVGDSINDLVNKINTATDASGNHLGIRAAYDADLDQLMMVTNTTGVDSYIKIADTAGFAETRLKLGTDVVTTGVAGKNALLEFNGTTVEKETNNFSIYGINIQLQSVSTEVASIQVDTNVDGIYEKIKSFVDSYNELIEEMYGVVNQEVYRDYPPLTDEQKEAMSEKEIELWEEKAKSGLLKDDGTITGIRQSIRASLYEKVEGVSGSYSHISQIGIGTASWGGEGAIYGKLVIDEAKLKEAISNDPEGVIDLFFKVPDTSLTGEEKTKNTGLVQRVYDEIAVGMKEVIRQSGTTDDDTSLYRSVQSNILLDFVTTYGSTSTIDKDLRDISTRIAIEEDRLIDKENHYWSKFTAMERALAEMNQQSSWLMSQLGMAQ